MAKRQVNESEYRRMLAARQGRKGGRFGTLLPQFQKTTAPSTTTLESVLQPTEPPVTAPQQSGGKIGLPTGPFDRNARTLLEEARRLSADVAIADNEQAQKIAAKLKVVRDLAKKTKGNQEALTAELDKVISPIEADLKKKASFRGFLQEKVADFRKKLPETLASKIPLVGGVVSGFLRQRREAKEGLEKYTRDLEGMKIGKGRGGFDVGGDSFGKSDGMQSTLGGIYAEVKKIRELVENKFAPESDTEELKKREAELEASKAGKLPGGKIGTEEKKTGLVKKLTDWLGIDSLMDIGSVFGKRGKVGRAFRVAKIAGKKMWRGLRGAGSKLARKASRGFRIGRIAAKKMWRGLKGSSIGKMAGRAWEATKSMGGKALGAAKSVGTKALGAAKSVGTKALEATKSAASSVAKTGGGMLSKAGGWLSRGWGAVTETASKLNPAKALGSAVKSGAGKIIKGIVSIPGLGAAISAGLAIKDIMDIKGNPELSADEKKDQIGRSVVGALGSGIGSVIGGVAGSALIPIPGLGTIVGTLGGMWAGEKLAELLADAVGGKGIYDMVASIPGIGSLVAVDETKPPETAGAEGQLENITESAAAGQSTATEVEGTLSAPSTPNTSVGRMVGEYSAQKEALGDAQMASSGAGRGGVVNNAKVETRVNNTVNNFNDDIRIRNNEPTLKTMQAAAHSF